MNNSTPLDRFSALFMPIVDSRFQLQISIDGDTIKLHIPSNLPEMNEGFTIGEFCKNYSDEMRNAIVATGEEIQHYQLSCGSLEFQKQNPRAVIKAWADYHDFRANRQLN